MKMPTVLSITIRCKEDAFYEVKEKGRLTTLCQRGVDNIFTWGKLPNGLFILFNTVPYYSELTPEGLDQIQSEIAQGTTIEEICSMLNLPR